MTTVYDAGRELARRYPHVTVRRVRLDGALAATLPHRQLILIADHLSQDERHACLTHELVHLDRGDQCTAGGGLLELKREHAVEREAARRLIPLERLAAALLWGRDEHELAQELGVDVHTFRVRMDHLTDAEREHLGEREQDWGAA